MACSMRPPACHLMLCLCDGVSPSALLLTFTLPTSSLVHNIIFARLSAF